MCQGVTQAAIHASRHRRESLGDRRAGAVDAAEAAVSPTSVKPSQIPQSFLPQPLWPWAGSSWVLHGNPVLGSRLTVGQWCLVSQNREGHHLMSQTLPSHPWGGAPHVLGTVTDSA